MKQPFTDRTRCLYIVLLIAIALLTGGVWLCYGSNPWRPSTPVVVRIDADMTGREIADTLAAHGVIANTSVFRAVLLLSGAARDLQEGTYRLHTNMSPMAAIQELKTGKEEGILVVIPEGFTIRQTARVLAQAGVTTEADFLDAARTAILPDDMRGNVPTDFPAEGFIFPDTYECHVPTPAAELVARMNRELVTRLTPELRQQIAAAGYSVHDFITLASLVEKEAKFEQDRPLIAAVFRKRLAIGMPLQSCASIQYILGEPKALLAIADTQIPSAYNTYLHAGLPPGPIGAPGLASMQAVLQAPETNYLYFVADAEGHHHFATTYEEHERNIEQVTADAPQG